MLTFFARFFGADAEAKAHLNKIAHVAVEYEKANIAIAKAEQNFKRVRDARIADFRNLKKATFAHTFDAVSRLIKKVDDEEIRVDEAHFVAKEKIAGKRESIDRLNRHVSSLDFPDF